MYPGYPRKQKSQLNISKQIPLSNSCRIDKELIERSARALASVTDPLEKLRLLCLTRGVSGIMALGRVFRKMDRNGTRRLQKGEFMNVIQDSSLELTAEEKEELFKRFEHEEERGSINIDDFITHLRPPLPKNRHHVLETAFRKLDKHNHGVATVADLRHVYSVYANPRYKSGEETEEVILKKFLDNFETKGKDDGKVTFEEFLNYYSGISISVDNDCTFDLMIRQAYKL